MVTSEVAVPRETQHSLAMVTSDPAPLMLNAFRASGRYERYGQKQLPILNSGS